tara:strand:+ start:352 stop:558 length:207 start_codon:yes stop_codon:yes gene_type:complete
MPGHYQGPPKPRPPKPPKPPKSKDPFDEQKTEDAAGKKRYNPFKGQYITIDGKKVPRTPTNASERSGG